MPRPDRKRTRLTGHAVAILLSVALAVLGWAPRAEAQIAPPLSARSSALHRARPSLPPAVRAVLRAARSQLGTPYVYGGSAPGGFDCSGFTMWAWAHAGVELPHNAAAQYDLVREHVDRGSLR